MAAAAASLTACGGGGGGGSPPPPPPPPPPPAPTITLNSGPIVRMVAQGTSVTLQAEVRFNNFTPTGTLHVTATDLGGPINNAVTVTPGANNAYLLTMTTAPGTPANRYNGLITLNFCADTACATFQPVPSLIIPRDIHVLSETANWPGDNRTPLSRWAGVADWTTFQGNAKHTGFVPVTLDPNTFSSRWQVFNTGGGVSFSNLPGRPIATGADKIFHSVGNVLYARSEFDNGESWSYDFSSLQYPSSNPPAFANDAVFIAAGQQNSTFFFSFAANDGALRFKTPMSSQWESYLNPVVGPSGVYTNAGTYGGMYGFDITGHQMFFAGLSQTSVWSPAVDASGVYTYTGYLQVTDPTTGAVLKTIADPTFTNYVYQINGAPVLGNDSVFVANYANSFLGGGSIGNTLLRFRPSTSDIAWMIPGVYPSTPAYADGVLYVANENPVRLEARAEANGALLWSWIPPLAGETSFRSEVLVTNNMLFVSTNMYAYGIDLTTRRVLFSWPRPARFALSANKILYLIEADRIAALNVG